MILKRNCCQDGSAEELGTDPPHIKNIIKTLLLACKRLHRCIHILSDSNVGSRPAERTTTSEVELEDLRAIPFCWYVRRKWNKTSQLLWRRHGHEKELFASGKKGQIQKLFRVVLEHYWAGSMMSLTKQYPATAWNGAKYGDSTAVCRKYRLRSSIGEPVRTRDVPAIRDKQEIRATWTVMRWNPVANRKMMRCDVQYYAMHRRRNRLVWLIDGMVITQKKQLSLLPCVVWIHTHRNICWYKEWKPLLWWQQDELIPSGMEWFKFSRLQRAEPFGTIHFFWWRRWCARPGKPRAQ